MIWNTIMGNIFFKNLSIVESMLSDQVCCVRNNIYIKDGIFNLSVYLRNSIAFCMEEGKHFIKALFMKVNKTLQETVIICGDLPAFKSYLWQCSVYDIVIYKLKLSIEHYNYLRILIITPLSFLLISQNLLYLNIYYTYSMIINIQNVKFWYLKHFGNAFFRWALYQKFYRITLNLICSCLVFSQMHFLNCYCVLKYLKWWQYLNTYLYW